MVKQQRTYHRLNHRLEASLRLFTGNLSTNGINTSPKVLMAFLGALKALPKYLEFSKSFETDVSPDTHVSPLHHRVMPNTQGTSTTDSASKESEEKPFRLSAKRVFLTYSQVPEEMSHQDVLDSLRNTIRFDHLIENYVIGKELHENEGFHFHVFLIAIKKFDTKKPNLLDLQYKGKTYHGNYQAAKGSVAQNVFYVCKEGDYETNLPNVVDGKLVVTRIEDEFNERARRNKNVDEALNWLIKNHRDKAAYGMGDRLKKLYQTEIKIERKLQRANKKPAFTSS